MSTLYAEIEQLGKGLERFRTGVDTGSPVPGWHEPRRAVAD